MTTARLHLGTQEPCSPHSDGMPAAKALARPASQPGRRLLRFAAALPARVLLFLIRVYQHTLSPALPVLTLGRCGCRFTPTCSDYAAEAIRTHGAIAGIALAAIRLVKCTPLHPGGFDPVPPRRPMPRCTRATPDSRLSPSFNG